jgi:predicted phosphoribosyltransferase
MLAAKLVPKYRYENCVVVALDDGGVMVGAQIAMQLHCIITLMVMEEINLPREDKAIAGMAAGGKFTYNQDYYSGEIEEFVGEYRSYIDEERVKKFHELNRLFGSTGLISPAMFRNHNIILVSDGLQEPIKLDLASELLKPINIEKLIVATPFADVPSIDKIHIMADEVYCLSVIDEPMETNHYYEKNDLPSHQTIIKTIEDIILKWR